MSVGMVAILAVVAFQTAPAQVEITPERPEIEVTGSAQLSVRAKDGTGRVLENVAVRWIASTPELASVDETGRVVGLNAGMARITAVVAGRPTSVTVVVRELPPAELRLELASTELYAGQAVPLRVQALNRLGDPVPNPELTFSSSDPSVAGVDAGGLVFARAAGSATIRVTGE
ncbi:MAG: Ig-like domain-containing protein, partial [Chloroflexota bacterium]